MNTPSPSGQAPLFSVPTLGQLHPFVEKEFLLTNGMGAYSASTILGCNTRRYHSLLIAATHPPLGRINTLARMGEILILDGQKDHALELSVNLFPLGPHPRGDRYLKQFDLDTTARWHYQVEGVTVLKELHLVWGQNLAGLRYTVTPDHDRPVRLELLPFVAMRDFHSLRRGTGASFAVHADSGHLRIGEYGSPHALHLRASSGHFEARGDWWRDHRFPVESERGQDDTEDLFNPGRFIVEAAGAFTVTVWFALEDPGQRDFDAELARHPDYAAPTTRIIPPQRPPGVEAAPPVGSLSPTMRGLVRAAGDFVVRRNHPDGTPGATVLAGYPWFADWGRDTMISLPGLMLVTGRFADARDVLTLFAQYVSQGMIPNRFDDYTNEPSYNTVDASLWFVHACFEYRNYSKDNQTFDQLLLPACKEVLRGYRDGTRYHIRMDPADGLITQGDASTQLTWMDAKMGSTVFTPRQGKPVEINALWYNALRLLGENELADKVRESFKKAFWISPFRGLADVVSGSGPYQRDQSVRPNQIFAVSLPHSPLTPEQQSAVVETVRRELLTPYGPRTLAKADRNYKGRYTGNQWHRDGAYHNGTVWPWLIGGFIEAYLKVNQFSATAQEQARQWLAPLLDHMRTAGCIGQIPENFDGDEPQRPVGTPAQAWSVAEVLRVAAMVGV